jgi:fructokinase
MEPGPVVVAGEALIDLIVRPDGSVTAVPGGGPYNAARTIARLGIPCAFLGRLSTDGFGRRLAATLADDGVGLELVETTDDPTTLALAELDATGAATYRFYLEGTSAPGLTAAALPAGTAALHVGTLGLRLEPVGSTIERLVHDVPADMLVMLDVNGRPSVPGNPAPWRERVRRIAARADVVKASVEDLAFLQTTADELAELGARTVLVTHGPDPVLVRTPGGAAQVPVPDVQVVDSVGAGDAFGGGFLAHWLAGGRDREALDRLDAVSEAARVAETVAALTCGRAGAEPPRREEVEGFGSA